jgi:hypothetical protein
MFRDHDFLDDDTLGTMRNMRRPGAFIFNCWVEAWGEHRWFPCEPGDEQAKQLAVMDGAPAEGIFRLNSIYPEDGFWWDSQLRITHAFQGGPHFLEHYAHAVASSTPAASLAAACSWTSALRGVSPVCRSLPGAATREVCDHRSEHGPRGCRTLVYGGQRYLYW